MLSYQQAFYNLKDALQAVYAAGEATFIAHAILEEITQKTKLERLSEKDSLLSPDQQARWEQAKIQLLEGTPLQYVTGVQWFLGMPFLVNQQVLIPRPETEELVQWIAADQKYKAAPAILDIGTGSGCIPIALKHKLPAARVTSCDISDSALQVAMQNAARLGATIDFHLLDFLREDTWASLDAYDVIVSNPPYIPFGEKEALDKNVRDFEPHTALFVPSDDALLFYRRIAVFGKTHLKPEGAIYCELHRDYAVETKNFFAAMGYNNLELRKDMDGNLRMLKAW